MAFVHGRRSFVGGSFAALTLGSCGRRRPGLRVLVAASVADVMAQVAEDYAAAAQAPQPEVSWAATSRLAAQIRGGAPGDVLLSADQQWMDALEQEHLVAPGTRRNLLGNRLVVVVPTEGGGELKSADDLRAVGRIALAGAQVPAGRYARAALGHLGVMDDLNDRIVDADNVRTALAWVARGEVPAGVVYATDGAAEPGVRVAFELPPATHPPIIYPIAVLSATRDPVEAERFVGFCQGPVAARRFEAAGFLLP